MTDTEKRPCVFFYVQHLLGIGHIARASRIAKALQADGFDVVLVTGGTPVPGFPGEGIRHVELPPIAVSDGNFAGLVDSSGKPVDDDFKRLRTDMLIGAYHGAKPDIVIIEAFPFGRRQVRFELLPLLDEIEDSEPRPLVMASLRDILQEKTKPGRDEETVSLVKKHFDAVLVHGDPDFARLEDTFPSPVKSASASSIPGSSPPSAAGTGGEIRHRGFRRRRRRRGNTHTGCYRGRPSAWWHQELVPRNRSKHAASGFRCDLGAGGRECVRLPFP